MNPERRRFVLAAGLAGALPASAANLQPTDDPEASPVWQKVRANLFAGRAIEPAGDRLVLDAPARAIDAAVVPVAIRSRLPQTPERRVARLVLVIDANPSPVGAIFTLGPDIARAEIETRVRVDAYSHVRAIAETNDGRLLMTTRFVKASGGCSAPPGGDAAAQRANLGRMALRVEGDGGGGMPLLGTLMIQHPNHSGLAMDQFTRQFTPPHFVRQVEVSYGGRPLLGADVDFSISENPNFRFWFTPRPGAALAATVTDSHGLRFASAGAGVDAVK